MVRKTFGIIMVIIVVCLVIGSGTGNIRAAEKSYITGTLNTVTPAQTVTADASKSNTPKTSNTAAATTSTPASVVINSAEQLYRYEVPSQATLLIDGLSVKLSDFRPGLEVRAEIQDQKIVSLESYSSEQPGYLGPSQKTKIATIIGFDTSLDEVRVRIGDEQMSFPLTPETIIIQNGTNISRARLCVGDHIKLYYDEYDDISRIEVEGSSIYVKDLVKGTLAYSNTLSKKITLKDVKSYENGQWVDYSSYLQLPLVDNTQVYQGTKMIQNGEIKYYSGKEAYAAISTSLGRDYIKKMVLKSSNERFYSSTIYQFNWDRDSINLTNSLNISLNEGTIIVQNGRLVDSDALDNRCQAAIIAESTSGQLLADVISVMGQGLNNSPLGDYHLYEGHIALLDKYYLQLSGVHNLDNNGWVSGGTSDFAFGNDTIIYDITGQKAITRQQFVNGAYEDYYGYLYAEDNNIIALAVQKAEIDVDDDNTSYGTIASTAKSATLGGMMTLTNMCDWSNVDLAWRDRDNNVQVNLTAAVILKHNKSIDASALSAGDRVFVVRTGYRARIVIVK